MIKTSITSEGKTIITADTKEEGQRLLSRVYGSEVVCSKCSQPDVQVEEPTCDCLERFGSGIVCQVCRPDLTEVFEREKTCHITT